MKKAIIFLFLSFILLLASCNSTNDSASLPDVDEVVHIQSHRNHYHSLGEVEDVADLIVEAVAKGVIDQNVTTQYHEQFGKELPSFGYTRREIEVTKVYKGDVEVGDALTLLEGYYVWTTTEGKKQLISSTSLTPAETNKKYLLFLRHHEELEGYWPAADYQGRYAISAREIEEKVKNRTLSQSDLDVYNHETLPFLVPFYHEVVEKYFR